MEKFPLKGTRSLVTKLRGNPNAIGSNVGGSGKTSYQAVTKKKVCVLGMANSENPISLATLQTRKTHSHRHNIYGRWNDKWSQYTRTRKTDRHTDTSERYEWILAVFAMSTLLTRRAYLVCIHIHRESVQKTMRSIIVLHIIHCLSYYVCMWLYFMLSDAHTGVDWSHLVIGIGRVLVVRWFVDFWLLEREVIQKSLHIIVLDRNVDYVLCAQEKIVALKCVELKWSLVYRIYQWSIESSLLF